MQVATAREVRFPCADPRRLHLVELGRDNRVIELTEAEPFEHLHIELGRPDLAVDEHEDHQERVAFEQVALDHRLPSGTGRASDFRESVPRKIDECGAARKLEQVDELRPTGRVRDVSELASIRQRVDQRRLPHVRSPDHGHLGRRVGKVVHLCRRLHERELQRMIGHCRRRYRLDDRGRARNDARMTSAEKTTDVLRVANCSGFYGDRIAAAKEMVEGGPIDVLTGDWLAELTMLILAKARRGGSGGYARTFVTQMEQVLGTVLDRGIKVVTNAGGLDPAGCADAVQQVAERLGLAPKIAYVQGDDLLPRLGELAAAGHELRNLDTGEAFGPHQAMTANAYLGGWGIAEALQQGADIVITGRVTDAAVVVGPAAWHFGWARDNWDALAGAVVAGHIIECGCQVTGGNYAFFTEVPGLEHPGFPIAEMRADGSCVITKHAGTGGLVSVGTVTAQLLYEIQSERYLNPDVVSRFDTIQVQKEDPDRVLVHGTRGEPAPPTTKVCINLEGGFRNSSTFCLTGLDIAEKAALVERTFWSHQRGGREAFAQATTRLVRTDKPDPATNEEGVALLSFIVKDPDERKVGRAFANVGVEMALSNYPGMFGTGGPSAAQPYGVYWPALVPSDLCPSEVVFNGRRTVVDATRTGYPDVVVAVPAGAPVVAPVGAAVVGASGPTTRTPIGRLIGARSGDKGGNANLGVWARSTEAFSWLDEFLTVDRLRELLPEARPLEVRRVALPNIRALNFVLVGLLEEGVAASTRMDAQAKGLGEYFRARVVDVPTVLLG